MPCSQNLSFCQTLPVKTFEQLGLLLHQMAQAMGTGAVVLTEAILLSIPTLPEQQQKRFSVLVSQGFSVLLVGEDEGNEPLLLNVSLTFEPEAIALFLFQLSQLLHHDPQAMQTLASYSEILQPNDATLQTQFTLLLLSHLIPQPTQEPPQLEYAYVSVCEPVESALRQQIAQEQLLNQVTTQIRQSLELPVILSTAVAQVRELLQIDRLVIYQFDPPELTNHHSSAQHSGCVVYEALATDAIPSVLNYQEETCFMQDSQCWQKYRQGFTLSIDDVEKTYILSKCLLGFMREIQVRAKLAAPIVIQEKLWGLLIAHQCHAPRHWLENEKNLLGQIAEQLAIAIYQAKLMRSLTLEKQTLEQRVIERTQALHDALIAAQAGSRAKSEFLAIMSHELRSPLTRIIGLSSTLLRWQLDDLSDRQRQYLKTIYDSGEHLLVLINDILDLSQLEAGKAVLNISEFSLVTLAQSSWRSFLAPAKQQKIDLTLDLKIEPPAINFSGDCSRIQQILWNLLSNAIKFTPEGGQVILRVWRSNNFAVFQVEDTGIGIPEHQLSLVFEKFQQLDIPYQRRYEGTGLGLALTKQLVELQHGRIEVESSVGLGSTFTVWLPPNFD